MTDADSPPPVPAATLVVFRDCAGGPPEILMVERARGMAFAAGAMVFPGGRVDAGDYLLADAIAGDRTQTAARIAAIRETIEETGIAVGITPRPDPEMLRALRARLHDGARFGDILAALELRLDTDVLVHFARWCPRHKHARIFDTDFYLARLPDGTAAASVDATENVRLTWTTAHALLDDADAGRAAIIFPTRRNLERLAQFPSFEAAVADAKRHRIEPITPWTEERNGVPHLCIPEGVGYPVTAEPLATAMRG